MNVEMSFGSPKMVAFPYVSPSNERETSNSCAPTILRVLTFRIYSHIDIDTGNFHVHDVSLFLLALPLSLSLSLFWLAAHSACAPKGVTRFVWMLRALPNMCNLEGSGCPQQQGARFEDKPMLDGFPKEVCAPRKDFASRLGQAALLVLSRLRL